MNKSTIRYIALAILIAIITNALWDFLIFDLFIAAGNSLVDVYSFFISGFKDMLYIMVGKRIDIASILITVTFILFISVFAPFLVLLITAFRRSKDETPKESEITPPKESLLNEVMNITYKASTWIISIGYPIIGIAFYLIASTNFSAISLIDQRLDILRPYIGEQQYHLLVSQSRMIIDLESMQKFVDESDKLGLKHGIELPQESLLEINFLE